MAGLILNDLSSLFALELACKKLLVNFMRRNTLACCQLFQSWHVDEQSDMEFAVSRVPAIIGQLVRPSRLQDITRDHVPEEFIPLEHTSVYLLIGSYKSCDCDRQTFIRGQELATLGRRYSVRQQKLSPAMLLPDHSTAGMWRASSLCIPTATTSALLWPRMDIDLQSVSGIDVNLLTTALVTWKSTSICSILAFKGTKELYEE